MILSLSISEYIYQSQNLVTAKISAIEWGSRMTERPVSLFHGFVVLHVMRHTTISHKTTATESPSANLHDRPPHPQSAAVIAYRKYRTR